jgi:hypothetical protein
MDGFFAQNIGTILTIIISLTSWAVMWGVMRQRLEDHERRILTNEKQNEMLRETIIKSNDLLREALNQHIGNRNIHTEADQIRDLKNEVNNRFDKLEDKLDQLRR